ncbi:unnamed protein product [Nyctereutes procyonoides]|uniref:(raccoon dog) hypothetical protein n=1 Tax=Nyctereutes procyonoides TaxID=34880 RepID=A0A811Z4T8_NYCPR|nr:unnamed protein product [Nyctereutes procyonoides]
MLWVEVSVWRSWAQLHRKLSDLCTRLKNALKIDVKASAEKAFGSSVKNGKCKKKRQM